LTPIGGIGNWTRASKPPLPVSSKKRALKNKSTKKRALKNKRIRKIGIKK
jgi:hypothetical protein